MNSPSYLVRSTGLALPAERLESEGGVVDGESREDGGEVAGESRENVELLLAVEDKLFVLILDI